MAARMSQIFPRSVIVSKSTSNMKVTPTFLYICGQISLHDADGTRLLPTENHLLRDTGNENT